MWFLLGVASGRVPVAGAEPGPLSPLSLWVRPVKWRQWTSPSCWRLECTGLCEPPTRSAPQEGDVGDRCAGRSRPGLCWAVRGPEAGSLGRAASPLQLSSPGDGPFPAPGSPWWGLDTVMPSRTSAFAEARTLARAQLHLPAEGSQPGQVTPASDTGPARDGGVCRLSTLTQHAPRVDGL